MTDFFTSVKLLCDLPYAAVGTCIKNRKNVPKLQEKLASKGEREVAVCSQGIIGIHGKDTEDVYLMSNCHKPTVTIPTQKQNNGTKQKVACHEAITFYNKHMGGVDHADQPCMILTEKTKSGGKRYFFAWC